MFQHRLIRTKRGQWGVPTKNKTPKKKNAPSTPRQGEATWELHGDFKNRIKSNFQKSVKPRNFQAYFYLYFSIKNESKSIKPRNFQVCFHL